MHCVPVVNNGLIEVTRSTHPIISSPDEIIRVMRVLSSVVKILVFDSVNKPVIQMYEMVCWGGTAGDAAGQILTLELIAASIRFETAAVAHQEHSR